MDLHQLWRRTRTVLHPNLGPQPSQFRSGQVPQLSSGSQLFHLIAELAVVFAPPHIGSLWLHRRTLEDSVNDVGSVPARIQIASRSGYNEFWEPGRIVSGVEAFNPGWINADGCDHALIVLITKSARRIGTRFHRLVLLPCRCHVYGVCESDTPTC